MTSAKSALELCSVLLLLRHQLGVLLSHTSSPHPNTLSVYLNASWEKHLGLADGHMHPRMNELCGAQLSSKFPKLFCRCLPQSLMSETTWKCVWLKPRRNKNQYTFLLCFLEQQSRKSRIFNTGLDIFLHTFTDA